MILIKKYWSVTSLVAILLIAFLLRARMFLYGDFFLLPDQGRDLQLVKQIVVDHKLTLIGGHTGGFGGLYHGPLWWYMIVPFFALFHGNPFWTLIPLYLIVSLGIVASGFFIVKKLYGTVWGLLFALFLCISHFLATTILFTSNAQPMPLAFLFYLFFVIFYIRGKDIFLIPTLILLAIGIHFEVGFAVTLVPITVFAMILRGKKTPIKIIISGLLLFFFFLGTYILFDIRHQFLQLKSFIALLSGHTTLTASWDMQYTNFWFRLSDRWASFLTLFQFPFFAGTLFSQVTAVGIVFLGIESFLYLKMKGRIKTQETKEMTFFIGILIICYTFYQFLKIPLQAHYTISLGVLVILLLVLSLKFLTKLSKSIGIIVVIIFMGIQLIPVFLYIQENYLQNNTYMQTSNGSYLNQLAVVDSIFQDSNKKPFGYFVFDPPIVTYSMDYLFWWRGTYKYHYVPVSQKLPITYLILNPYVGGDLHAWDFWQINTIRTKASVEKGWTQKGNITIKKLVIDPTKEQPVNPNYYQNFIFR